MYSKQCSTESIPAKRGENVSPRNRKAYRSIGTALLQIIAEMGTQSTMKSSRKTLH
jgi:hypothetical protein